MPEDLLLELETAVPLAKSLENIEDLVRILVRQTGEAVENMKGLANAFTKIWQTVVVEVGKGRTTEMQAARPRLLSYFETRLKQLKHTQALVACLSALGRASSPDSDALIPEIDAMERLKARVFDRWQSSDDLERLAVEHYPLSQARLQQLAATHGPPAEWYEGEEEQLLQE